MHIEVSGMMQNPTLACPGVVHWCAYTPGALKSIKQYRGVHMLHMGCQYGIPITKYYFKIFHQVSNLNHDYGLINISKLSYEYQHADHSITTPN